MKLIENLSNAITGGNIDEVIRLTTPHPESGITKAHITKAVNSQGMLYTLASCTNPEILDAVLHYADLSSYHGGDFGTYSILCIAIENNNSEMVQKLLEKNARLDIPLMQKGRLLKRAFKEQVEYIIKKDMLPYDYALAIGKTDIAELIKNHAESKGIETYYKAFDTPEKQKEIQDAAESFLGYSSRGVGPGSYCYYDPESFQPKFTQPEMVAFIKECIEKAGKKRYIRERAGGGAGDSWASREGAKPQSSPSHER